MDRQHWDLRWKLWTWQRFQQFVGAAIVIVPAGYFLVSLTQGELPADFRSDVSVDKADHRTIDHTNIAYAIGSCHLSGNISTWPADWLRTLRISSLDLNDPPVVQASVPSSGPTHDQELTSFERAALWHSSRIIKERERFLHDAEERQDRARRNQLRLLCLSAAAAFLVSLKALATNKDDDAPFRSLTKGALMPVSILALLMPVLATAVSGVATFDGDPNVVVRDIRTLSQLEQLHGRIAEDVTGDPFLCPIMRATSALYSRNTGVSGARVWPVDTALLTECLMDRTARTNAWEQRHEQILNDATPSLAHAGDLPRGADKPAASPTGTPSPRPAGDVCQAAFAQVQPEVATTGDKPSRDALNVAPPSEPRREPM